jgi:hypothetical protein
LQVYKKKQEMAKKDYLKQLAAYRAENLQVNSIKNYIACKIYFLSN